MAGGDGNELELLVDRACAGDAGAFDAVVRHTHRLAFQLAYRMLGDESDAEDVLQDAYLRAWRGLSGLRDRGAALGWICQLVRNVATDRLRRQRRRAAVGEDQLLALLGSAEDADPERALASAQERVVIATAIAQLKEKHRLVLLLREVDDMSYDEIAAALGCPIGTVESRLYRARRLLADKLRRAQRKREEEAA